MKTILFLLIVACFQPDLTWATTQSAEQELAELKAQLKALTQQVSELEKRLQSQSNNNPQIPVTEQAVSNLEKSPQEKINFSGDFRGRLEYIDERLKTVKQRSRIRLRLGVEASINDLTSLHVRLATGGDNPTSTNFTLDDGFSRKDFGLDRAYIKHDFNNHHALLGKMKNPFIRPGSHGILFDSDLNPEGIAVNFSQPKWQAVLAGFYLDERKNDDEILLLASQFAFTHDFINGQLELGLGYYDYQNLQGALPVYQNKLFGNRFNTSNQLINDFNIGEIFAQYNTDQFPRPLSVYSTFLKNTAANDENTAYMAGFKYGSAKKPHDWQFAYSYQYTEADAVYGLFNGSDFAGGMTDARGHLYQFTYGLKPNMALGFTWIDAIKGMHLGTATDYDRLMLDMSYWFK